MQTYAASSTGYELDYFHAYKASKTYAIRLKNGLKASFDFANGTATMDDGATRTTIPLEDALLQASNGNVQAAAAMYDEMYDSISAAHADTIMASVGSGGYGAHGFPRWNDEIGLNNPLWGSPTGGSCWPVPFPCHEWSGGLSNWGAYNQWWSSPFGSPPPTPQPPNPSGCAPGDDACLVREIKRQIACDELPSKQVDVYVASGTAGGACRLGMSAGPYGFAVICGGGLLNFGRATHARNRTEKACRTP